MRIAAVSGSLRTVSMARLMPDTRSRRRWRSGLQLASIVGHGRQAFLEDRHDIEQAVEIAFEKGGGRHRPLVAGRRHRDQVSGKIAAVDAGNVARAERRQRPGFVPVVEMAAIGRQLLDRGDGRRKPVGGLHEADPAEVARRNDRQQVDADIGGRGAAGHDRCRGLLEIVRRQHVVLGRDEGLEIQPGAAPVGAQPRLVRLRHDQPVLGFGRAADQPGEGRRAGPEQREDQRDAGAGGAGRQRDGQPDEADHHRAIHRAVVADDRVVARLVGLQGGAPLQQIAVADVQPVEGAHDRVAHQPCRMRKQHDTQRHLRGGEGGFAPQRAQMAARRCLRILRHDRVDDVEGRRHEQHQDQQAPGTARRGRRAAPSSRRPKR